MTRTTFRPIAALLSAVFCAVLLQPLMTTTAAAQHASAPAAIATVIAPIA